MNHQSSSLLYLHSESVTLPATEHSTGTLHLRVMALLGRPHSGTQMMERIHPDYPFSSAEHRATVL